MRKLNRMISYGDYKDIQVSRASKKWGNRQTARDRIGHRFDQLFREAGDLLGDRQVIGCMGIRNGMEYFEFKKRITGAEVYGVDLGDRVTEVGENCFQYDFNKLPDAWEGKFDLVFSNSLDHSYIVKDTITEWRRVLKLGGLLVLDLSTAEPNWADRFAFEESDISKILPKRQFEIVKQPFMRTDDTFMVIARRHA